MGSILGGQSTENPANLAPWARDVIGGELVRGPAQRFNDITGFENLPGLSSYGPFGDVLGGFGSMTPEQLFGGLGGFPAFARDAGGMYGMMGLQGGAQAFGANQGLAQRGDAASGAGTDWLSSLTQPSYGAAIDYAGPLYGMLSGNGPQAQQLSGLLRGGPSTGPFSGQAEGAALDQMKNTGPNGDIYNRTMANLLPQVRASYGARGLVGGGAAANAETKAATDLGDQFAQRAMQERIGLLGQAVGGEGANASMTGALNSALASIYGSQVGGAASMFGNQINAGLQAPLLPGQVQGQFMNNMGQAGQNYMGLAGLNMTPLQAGLQGANLSMQGMQMPFAIGQQAYNLTRTPYLQLMQAAAGAAPLSQGSEYRGLFGIPK